MTDQPKPDDAPDVAALLKGTTDGPWRANRVDHPTEWCIHAVGTPWQLAYLRDDQRADWPLEANARLIAAAPTLARQCITLTNALAVANARVGGIGAAADRLDQSILAYVDEIKSPVGNNAWSRVKQAQAKLRAIIKEPTK